MAAVNKIDSNATLLSYAEEASYKTLPGTPDWVILEPNSYADFGGEVTTVARNPINSSRQRKKGVLTDLDASGGFNSDLTQTNLEDLLQGFFFADLRLKGEEIVTAVDEDTTNPDEYEVADTTGFQVNDLIQGKNFTNAANNAVNVVTAVVSNVSVEVATGQLVAETPPATAQITVVGHRAGSADIDVVVSGDFPHYFSNGGVDFTTLGLIPGEWIFVGGDLAANQFVNAQNNGWKRIKSITATQLTVDKSDSTMVVETGTALLIDFYFGRVLKNESAAASQVRRTYNLERQLGAPDDASPSNIQAEYIEGAVPNEATFNIPTADKLTTDLSFVAADHTTIDGPTSLKSGNRPALVETDAFNTSSDFSRIKLAVVDDTTEAPSALFTFAQEVTLTINNNVSPNKAVGTLGAFDVTAGTFEVGGSITAYFSNTTAIDQIRANADVTLDVAIVKGATGLKTGIAMDLPLITLGDGRLNVEQDEPVTLPLNTDAATGAGVDANMDHTFLMVFFDHLPDAADT
jgi:hypothetical protein